MRRFRLHQRVRVKLRHFDLDGKTGQVVCVRKADDSAWVDMDDPLPGELLSFSEGDPHGRENHIVLYPAECVAIPEGKSWATI